MAVAAEDDGRILCAPEGADGFARACSLDRTLDAEGMVLTLQLPDGGFRRMRVTRDGGLVPADGAERAEVRTVADGLIEVAIGGARFRLPETITRS
ncbi:hypothetical protein FBR43_08510 [Sphingomonas baiyangensis]|uniref:Uncharacterized protein n=1 Tax=Sphingomonas baiyangensis TaxID=2572576 RepID=A0A4V5PWM6_9SPHN|nr:hypothetical protein FBR43_08510 [Sphingomonas baiyangensis]